MPLPVRATAAALAVVLSCSQARARNDDEILIGSQGARMGGAVTAIVGFGFAELRLERIWLNVWTENARARRAYEKAGFVHEGTIRHDRYEHGEHTSGDLMSILREEWTARSMDR